MEQISEFLNQRLAKGAESSCRVQLKTWGARTRGCLPKTDKILLKFRRTASKYTGFYFKRFVERSCFVQRLHAALRAAHFFGRTKQRGEVKRKITWLSDNDDI